MKRLLNIVILLVTILVALLALQVRFIDYHFSLYQFFRDVNQYSSGYVNRYGFYLVLGRGFFIHWLYILLPLGAYHLFRIVRFIIRKAQNRAGARYEAGDSLGRMDHPDMEERSSLPGVFMDSPYDGDTWTLEAGKKTGKAAKTPGDRPAGNKDFDPEIFLSLTRALSHSLDVEITYQNREGEPSERRITPIHMYRMNGTYYLKGYCHLRDEGRTFRLDRIDRLSIRQ
jgi:hypothetical protein